MGKRSIIYGAWCRPLWSNIRLKSQVTTDKTRFGFSDIQPKGKSRHCVVIVKITVKVRKREGRNETIPELEMERDLGREELLIWEYHCRRAREKPRAIE